MILVVEDSEDDWFLFQRALKQAKPHFEVRRLCNGQQAMDYLEGSGNYVDRTAYPLPSMILLDLKMPLKNGFAVLSWIRQNLALRRLVVIVLTTSPAEADVARAYDLGANAFLTKPTASQLIGLVKAIETFWIGHNRFAQP